MTFTWSAFFYLFLVFVAPLALVNQASAQEDDQVPLADKEDLGTVIGIDLGTTYSCVSGPLRIDELCALPLTML